jgi:ribosome-associated translation inhibitor RaiA
MFNMMAFFMHVKKHETGYKGKTNYSIRVRVRTDKGMFISQSSKWDLRDAVGESLDKLERIMIHKKEKTRDISKDRNEKRKAAR